jgi:hypothetical protein
MRGRVNRVNIAGSSICKYELMRASLEGKVASRGMDCQERQGRVREEGVLLQGETTRLNKFHSLNRDYGQFKQSMCNI